MGPGLIITAAAVVLWLAGWVILARITAVGLPREPADGVAEGARLSIIVPARNEEHNLPRLLQSIAAQEVAPPELLVVDDGSSDRTAEIARSHGARVITSAALPDDWRGKPWACHQGAGAASGQRLLFIDADAWFEPGGLAALLSAHDRGVLSVGPYHATRRPYEQLSAIFNLVMVAGTVPHGLFGQLLLVDRQSYLAIGGHERVKGRILENFHLAEQFRQLGVPVRSIPGRGTVSFRMYPGGVGDLVEGWTKGFASGAGRTPKPVLLLVVAWLTGLVLPLVAVPMSPAALWLYPAFALQLGLLLRRVGNFSWLTAFCYPVPLLFYFVVFARSLTRAGRTVTWKGREIRAR